MKSLEMTGSARTNVGGKASKQARTSGMVPCVLYGACDPVHFEIDSRQFNKLLYTADVFLVKLKVGDKEYDALLKDAQFHPVTDEIRHADFYLPKEGSEVTIGMPVVLTGTSPGVLNGGKLRQYSRKVKVKGLLADMPDSITVDISSLRIGQGIRIHQMSHEGLEFVDAPSNYVVYVKMARGAVADAEEEATEE